MKKKSIKIPKQMTKREAALQDIQKLLRKAMAVKPLSIKRVVFNDGVYTALNEHDQPVAFFGEQFKQAVDQFLPEYKRFSSSDFALQPYQKEFLRRADEKPVSPPVRNLVAAYNFECFREFIRRRAVNLSSNYMRSFVHIHYADQLAGYRINDRTRLILLPHWDENKTSYFVQAVLRLQAEQERFDKHVGLS